ncbi:hypothetical protein LC724_32810 [Blautia sp. RD014234]|nr:hypothetical protein [Blautia parvula]
MRNRKRSRTHEEKDCGSPLLSGHDYDLAGRMRERRDSGTNSAKETEQKSDETEQKSEETSAKADASAKDEVTIGFSNDADSWDPCTGFGYTGSPCIPHL